MTPEKIQAEVDRLCTAMLAKGLKQPRVQFEIESGKLKFCTHINWTVNPHINDYAAGNRKYEFLYAETADEVLANTAAYIEALPGREETQMRQFMEAVSAAVEIGRQNGIDADLLNPLQATMQALSANIITDQRPKPFDDDGEIPY